MSTDPWGIIDGYHDALGVYHATDDATRSALRAAMGVDADAPGSSSEPARVVLQGDTPAIAEAARLDLEDGAAINITGALPPDLPIGYHTLQRANDAPQNLIVAPRACFYPESMRAWGFSVQLYATRSENSWGMGDLADLRHLAAWSKELGAGLLMVSPLCASMCGASRIHPYSPCSRVFRNLLYLRIEEIPGARQAPEIAQLSSDALRLNQERNIDYQAIINLKLRAIELLWSRFGGDERFERYCRSEGVSLRRFAIFNALVERHGAGWRRWPEEYRHPKSPAVERFASENEDRVRFRQWIQWLIDEQLREAATTLPLMMDLPIGFDPDGADAWAYQDLLAFGARIGAPPDDFNPNGQEWGLPPFIPHKLRASGYRPFIETVRASLRHASALRIDHVMGLSRLYWVPEGRSPREGTYIRYSFEEQLAVLAVESHRARAWILGEDLGTVEDHVRERLAACRIPSYRLACFEQRLPRDYPPLSFAAVTTHDLPTLAGLLNGRELEMRRTIGIPPHEEALKAMRARMDRLTENQAAAAHDDALVDIYRSLAHAPSAVVVATLEDALAVNEPPNRPGTTHEWPNWSLALPLMLDEISRHDLPRRLAAALKR